MSAMSCASCGASEFGDTLECPRCGRTFSSQLDGPMESTLATPLRVTTATPLETPSSMPDNRLQNGSLGASLPTEISTRVPPIKVGLGIQVAAVILFIIGIYMGSYSVTTYYYTGRFVTRYPLLIPGIVVGIIAIVAATIGTVIVRRSKAKSLAWVLTKRD